MAAKQGSIGCLIGASGGNEDFELEAPEPGQSTATAPAATPVRARYRYAGLAVALLIIVGVIWLLQGGLSADTTADATTVTLTGATGGVTPKIGEPAPEFSLDSLDGRKLGLADFRGHPVVVNFWASWCPPCRGEMPDLQNLSTDYADTGLVVLAINLEEERDAVQRYSNNLGLTFPIVLDRRSTVANRYNLTGLPTSYFVGPDGTIRDLNIGALTKKGLQVKIAKILN